MACSLPHPWLLRTWRGYRADRGPELVIIPKEPNFLGSGLPHVGPWDYDQRVPMLWYGPGYIRAQGAVDRPVTSAGIAPTEAQLLRFPFRAPDGSPMGEALLPATQRQAPPRLIVTLVWDAGGRDVLSAWPNDWPFLKSLIPRGTWYENATVGSSPTSTAQIHATIGTGAFPMNHGLVGHRMRVGGTIASPWADGPAFLIRPTLADLYDRAMRNAPVVGEVGTVAIHLGMLGHGAMWGGGDPDLAVLRAVTGATTLGAEGFEWNVPSNLQPYFRFPSYVNSVPGFAQDVRAVDQADGKLDGKWRNNSIDQLLMGFDTPARTPYENRVVEEIIEREGFGADATPDLLFLNFKEIDYISHIWSMNSLEMKDAVDAQDAALKAFVDFLDQQVGADNYVLLVTADHGAVPSPAVSGAFQISATPVAKGINGTFDHDGDGTKIVQLVQPTGIFIDTAELKKNGYTLAQVSQYIMGLTEAQTAGARVTVPPGKANTKVFQAAFPSSIMRGLACLPEARG